MISINNSSNGKTYIIPTTSTVNGEISLLVERDYPIADYYSGPWNPWNYKLVDENGRCVTSQPMVFRDLIVHKDEMDDFEAKDLEELLSNCHGSE